MRNPDVSAWVQAHADEIVDSLQELMRRGGPCSPPAAAGPGNAQDFVAAEVQRLGLEYTRLVPDLDAIRHHRLFRQTDYDYRERPVIIGQARGRGGGRSLVLNAHADIVGPGDHQRWTHPPFAAVRAGDRIVGRGAADDKGPLTALLFGLVCARAVSGGLAGDVTFMSVADEEVGGMCTLAALAAGYTGDAGLVGEPTGLAIAPASRGASSFRLDITGREAHSGTAFLGVNAIEKAMLYAQAMRQLEADLDRQRPHPLYAALPVTHCFNIGRIEGGSWAGVVPGSCTLEVTAGAVAGESVAQLRSWVLERIEMVTAADPWLREHPPVLTWTQLNFEPGFTPAEHPFVQAALSAGERVLGHKPELLPLLGGSDLRFFTDFGIPAAHVGCGAMLDGHTYDEAVTVTRLLQCTELVAELILDWCR